MVEEAIFAHILTILDIFNRVMEVGYILAEQSCNKNPLKIIIKYLEDWNKRINFAEETTFVVYYADSKQHKESRTQVHDR